MSEKIPPGDVPFWRSPRKILHAFTFGFIFCITVAELGLVSHQLHKYGNDEDAYPTKEYKNDIGLLLYSSIATLLFIIGHPFAGLGIAAFASFVLAVFWGTGAGIIYQLTPFKGTRCGNDVLSFPVAWQPYASQCSKIVTIEALAWTLWGIFIILFFAILYQAFDVKRTARQTLYGV